MRFLLFIISFLFYFGVYAQQKKLAADESKVLFNVHVFDFSDVPQSNERIMIEGSQNKKVFYGLTDAGGTFSVLIPKGDKYFIKYKEFDSYKDYSALRVPADSGLYTFEVNVRYEHNEIYTLKSLQFEVNNMKIKEDSFSELDELADLMKRKPKMKIEIAGHTDNIGKPDYNLVLSKKRAESVRNYLIEKGVNKDRIVSKGYGANEPIESNDTESGRAVNRRTEVRILTE